MRRVWPRYANALAMGAGLILVSCQSAAAPQPAVLERADAASIGVLKSVIGEALGTARIEFGALDLENAPHIPVLPARPDALEGHSPALPIHFDLAVQDGACLVIERSSGDVFAAADLRCKPAGD